jgi:hypothetical protein
MSELKRLQRHRAVKPMNNVSKPLDMETPMETELTVPLIFYSQEIKKLGNGESK